MSKFERIEMVTEQRVHLATEKKDVFRLAEPFSRGLIHGMNAFRTFGVRAASWSSRGMLRTLAIVLLVAATALAGDVPSLSEPGLGSGPFSSMHMMLEKTILKVDVATIDVKVGPSTQEKFKQILGGKPYSAAAEAELAKAAMDADRAVIQLKFVRDVTLKQWIDGVRESLEAAEKAGLLSASVRKQVSEGLPVWFKPVESRGYKNGDRVLYRIEPNQIRTVAVTREGQVLVDRVDQGADKRRIVLTSYFAPGTDYRQLLLSSLK
ncbi:MAG: hypothetical protein B6A08_00680 [Sorangiineae bacterium NIC37A_2]|jgi:hypothetical protein|nr:MAG: hypothetical protein B6A08_00680 [Sorangiineae bacterium NIC37A_2]